MSRNFSKATADETSARPFFVTGARGAIGRAVMRKAEAMGLEVTGVSRTAGDEFLAWDEFLGGGGPGEGTVIHCAWSTVPASSEERPGIEREEDFPLMERMVRRLGSSRGKWRLVFLSSGGTTYGEGGAVPHVESDVCEPIGWHGRMKLEAERLLERLAPEHGVELVIVRPSNVYGFDVAEARPQGLIPHAIHAAREGRPLVLWGDGSAVKDYVHAADFLGGLFALVASGETGTFNLSSGASLSVRELLALVEAATKRPIAIEVTPRRPWDVQISRLSHMKLIERTGWVPSVPLREGIDRTVAELSR
jgi:UDP-glucose 4-epimerase